MKYSLDDYLAVGLRSLADGLAAPEQLASMRAIARRLPPSADFGFECRLSDDDDAVDLLARLVPDDGTRAAYAGANAASYVAPELLRNGAWRRLQAFCARWAAPDDPLHDEIRDMWIELDRAELDGRAVTPCLFVQPRNETAAQGPITRALSALLHGRHDEMELPAAARRCFAAAPGRANVAQAGVMISRPRCPIRLFIQTEASSVSAFLSDVGWPGPFSQLDHFLSEIAPFAARFAIDLDVSETISPRIGFECFFQDGASSQQRFAALVERLIALGLCAPGKGAALMRWKGAIDPASTTAPWPSNLQRAAQRLGWRSVFLRRVNHLKIVYSDGALPMAKAYFGLTHRWLMRRSQNIAGTENEADRAS